MSTRTSKSIGAVFILALLAGIGMLSIYSVSAGENPASVNQKSSSCGAPEYRQFDFWVEDWDVFDVSSTIPSARVKVDLLLDGCVLREEYNGADGHRGESLSIYDSSRKVWHQSWVTNRGELLTIEGTFQSGEMILAGADRTADGKERRGRGIWKPEKGGVRETAVTSTDGGKTWKPWFDLEFRPITDFEAAQRCS